jgi:parallel beta-helix repeat protein
MKAVYILLLLSFTLTSNAAIFTVTTTADAGAGSLRQAIVDLNATVLAAPHEIRFAIGAANSLQTITLTAALNDIAKSDVTLDGRTQGAGCGPYITINFGGLFKGFRSSTGMNNITIQGLCLQNGDRAILLQGGSGHIIRGCYIGLNSAGNAPHTYTGSGILDAIALQGCSNTTIGGINPCDRNYVGAFRHGIVLEGTGSNHTLYNNVVGLCADGSTLAGNAQDGIRVDDSNTNVTIGGAGSVQKNISSGNGYNGININTVNNTGCSVIGNTIGLDETGLLERSNGRSATAGIYAGIVTNASLMVQNNVIAGNGLTYPNYVFGVYFAAGNNHLLLNNIIGLDVTGIANASNFGSYDDGVRYVGVSNGHVISGNVICNAGNGQANVAVAPNAGRGIAFMDDVTNVVVYNNKIGVDITGNTRKGNYEHGLFFNDDATNVTIGGSVANRNIFGDNGYRAGATANLRHGIGAVVGGKILSGFTISHNYVGVGADGITNVGNSNFGIGIRGLVSSLIEQNICWYNRVGIFLATSGTSALNGNTIQSNNISYNNDATSNCAGIVFQQGCNYNKILNNTIQYNKQGIWIRAQTPPATGGNNDNNLIRGNEISYNTGTTVGTPYSSYEASGNGVVISGESDRNYIGGTHSSHDNFIHHNGSTGILVYGSTVVAENSTENKIRRNSIYCNGGDGIDLFNDGNNSKAHPGAYIDPLITTPILQATTGGNLASDTVEIFYDDACGDCEGKTYLGYATVSAAGQWTFSPIPATNNLTARGTANTNAVYANTSEFSSCVGIPLPIRLLYFTYTLQGDQVELNWRYDSEEGLYTTELYSSEDGINWEKVTELNSQRSLQYSTIDPEALSGQRYYRLIYLTEEGTFNGPVISVNAHKNQIQVFQLSPDGPVELYIHQPEQNDLVTVLNTEGKIIFQGKITSGHTTFGYEWAAGMYTLLVSGKKSTTLKFIKY